MIRFIVGGWVVCISAYQHTSWLYSVANFRVESPVQSVAVLPVIFLVLEAVFEGVLSPSALAHGTSPLPLSLKLTTVGEE